MRRALFVVVALATAVACKSDPAKERARKAADAKDFWPEAPKPTTTTAKHAFRYNPDHITGYTLLAKGGTPPGAKVGIDFDMTLALRFDAGTAPRERDAYIKVLALDVKAAGQGMKMRIDHDVLSVETPNKPAVVMKRGEAGPIDVAAITDKPLTTLVFGDDNVLATRTIEDHPLNQLGSAGDMLDTGLVLFPDLPREEIAAGHEWTIVRKTTIGATHTKFDVTYDFVYVGDGACPSGAKSCSLFTFTASTPGKDITSEGITMRVAYGFAGKVYFDLERNVIDDSRVRMDLDMDAKGMDMAISGTYTIKPST